MPSVDSAYVDISLSKLDELLKSQITRGSHSGQGNIEEENLSTSDANHTNTGGDYNGKSKISKSDILRDAMSAVSNPDRGREGRDVTKVQPHDTQTRPSVGPKPPPPSNQSSGSSSKISAAQTGFPVKSGTSKSLDQLGLELEKAGRELRQFSTYNEGGEMDKGGGSKFGSGLSARTPDAGIGAEVPTMHSGSIPSMSGTRGGTSAKTLPPGHQIRPNVSGPKPDPPSSDDDSYTPTTPSARSSATESAGPGTGASNRDSRAVSPSTSDYNLSPNISGPEYRPSEAGQPGSVNSQKSFADSVYDVGDFMFYLQKSVKDTLFDMQARIGLMLKSRMESSVGLAKAINNSAILIDDELQKSVNSLSREEREPSRGPKGVTRYANTEGENMQKSVSANSYVDKVDQRNMILAEMNERFMSGNSPITAMDIVQFDSDPSAILPDSIAKSLNCLAGRG